MRLLRPLTAALLLLATVWAVEQGADGPGIIVAEYQVRHVHLLPADGSAARGSGSSYSVAHISAYFDEPLYVDGNRSMSLAASPARLAGAMDGLAELKCAQQTVSSLPAAAIGGQQAGPPASPPTHLISLPAAASLGARWLHVLDDRSDGAAGANVYTASLLLEATVNGTHSSYFAAEQLASCRLRFIPWTEQPQARPVVLASWSGRLLAGEAALHTAQPPAKSFDFVELPAAAMSALQEGSGSRARGGLFARAAASMGFGPDVFIEPVTAGMIGNVVMEYAADLNYFAGSTIAARLMGYFTGLGDAKRPEVITWVAIDAAKDAEDKMKWMKELMEKMKEEAAEQAELAAAKAAEVAALAKEAGEIAGFLAEEAAIKAADEAAAAKAAAAAAGASSAADAAASADSAAAAAADKEAALKSKEQEDVQAAEAAAGAADAAADGAAKDMLQAREKELEAEAGKTAEEAAAASAEAAKLAEKAAAADGAAAAARGAAQAASAAKAEADAALAKAEKAVLDEAQNDAEATAREAEALNGEANALARKAAVEAAALTKEAADVEQGSRQGVRSMREAAGRLAAAAKKEAGAELSAAHAAASAVQAEAAEMEKAAADTLARTEAAVMRTEKQSGKQLKESIKKFRAAQARAKAVEQGGSAATAAAAGAVAAAATGGSDGSVPGQRMFTSGPEDLEAKEMRYAVMRLWNADWNRVRALPPTLVKAKAAWVLEDATSLEKALAAAGFSWPNSPVSTSADVSSASSTMKRAINKLRSGDEARVAASVDGAAKDIRSRVLGRSAKVEALGLASRQLLLRSVMNSGAQDAEAADAAAREAAALQRAMEMTAERTAEAVVDRAARKAKAAAAKARLSAAAQAALNMSNIFWTRLREGKASAAERARGDAARLLARAPHVPRAAVSAARLAAAQGPAQLGSLLGALPDSGRALVTLSSTLAQLQAGEDGGWAWAAAVTQELSAALALRDRGRLFIQALRPSVANKSSSPAQAALLLLPGRRGSMSTQALAQALTALLAEDGGARLARGVATAQLASEQVVMVAGDGWRAGPAAQPPASVRCQQRTPVTAERRVSKQAEDLLAFFFPANERCTVDSHGTAWIGIAHHCGRRDDCDGCNPCMMATDRLCSDGALTARDARKQLRVELMAAARCIAAHAAGVDLSDGQFAALAVAVQQAGCKHARTRALLSKAARGSEAALAAVPFMLSQLPLAACQAGDRERQMQLAFMTTRLWASCPATAGGDLFRCSKQDGCPLAVAALGSTARCGSTACDYNRACFGRWLTATRSYATCDSAAASAARGGGRRQLIGRGADGQVATLSIAAAAVCPLLQLSGDAPGRAGLPLQPPAGRSAAANASAVSLPLAIARHGRMFNWLSGHAAQRGFILASPSSPGSWQYRPGCACDAAVRSLRPSAQPYVCASDDGALAALRRRRRNTSAPDVAGLPPQLLKQLRQRVGGVGDYAAAQLALDETASCLVKDMQLRTPLSDAEWLALLLHLTPMPAGCSALKHYPLLAALRARRYDTVPYLMSTTYAGCRDHAGMARRYQEGRLWRWCAALPAWSPAAAAMRRDDWKADGVHCGDWTCAYASACLKQSADGLGRAYEAKLAADMLRAEAAAERAADRKATAAARQPHMRKAAAAEVAALSGLLPNASAHELPAHVAKEPAPILPPEELLPCSPRDMDSSRLRDNGLALVKHFEGFSASCYKDPRGVWTVGSGHACTPRLRDAVCSDGDCKLRGALNASDGQRLLQLDIARAEECVRSHVEVELTPNQFDALTSFAFSLRTCAELRASPVLQAVNRASLSVVPTLMSRATAGCNEGVMRRRFMEGRLWGSCARWGAFPCLPGRCPLSWRFRSRRQLCGSAPCFWAQPAEGDASGLLPCPEPAAAAALRKQQLQAGANASEEWRPATELVVADWKAAAPPGTDELRRMLSLPASSSPKAAAAAQASANGSAADGCRRMPPSPMRRANANGWLLLRHFTRFHRECYRAASAGGGTAAGGADSSDGASETWHIGLRHNCALQADAWCKPDVLQPEAAASCSGTMRREEAEAAFLADLRATESCIASAVRVNISDNQFAALVAYAFARNCDDVRGGPVLRAVNARRWRAVPYELSRMRGGCLSERLLRERFMQALLFQSCDPAGKFPCDDRRAGCPISWQYRTEAPVCGGRACAWTESCADEVSGRKSACCPEAAAHKKARLARLARAARNSTLARASAPAMMMMFRELPALSSSSSPPRRLAGEDAVGGDLWSGFWEAQAAEAASERSTMAALNLPALSAQGGVGEDRSETQAAVALLQLQQRARAATRQAAPAPTPVPFDAEGMLRAAARPLRLWTGEPRTEAERRVQRFMAASRQQRTAETWAPVDGITAEDHVPPSHSAVAEAHAKYARILLYEARRTLLDAEEVNKALKYSLQTEKSSREAAADAGSTPVPRLVRAAHEATAESARHAADSARTALHAVHAETRALHGHSRRMAAVAARGGHIVHVPANASQLTPPADGRPSFSLLQIAEPWPDQGEKKDLGAMQKTITEQLVHSLTQQMAADITVELTAIVHEGVSEHLSTALSEKVPDEIFHKLAHVLPLSVGRPVAYAVPIMIYKMLPQYLSAALTHTVTHTVTRALTHTLAPTLLHTLSESPWELYFCYLCQHSHMHCAQCPAKRALRNEAQAMYYLDYFADYYSDYYADFFAGNPHPRP